MIERDFSEIGISDIQPLVDDGVCESKTLEYKQELPGGTDSARKEFLADVSSFGNASGGDIIFGMKPAVDDNGKKTGAVASIQPISGQTPDDVIQRLEQSVLNGIRPHLPVQTKAIPVKEEGFVLL
jgi:predicted HTH transcriptional regulator